MSRWRSPSTARPRREPASSESRWPGRRRRRAESPLRDRGALESALAVAAPLAADAGGRLRRELHPLRSEGLAAVLADPVASKFESVERPSQLLLKRRPQVGDPLRD